MVGYSHGEPSYNNGSIFNQTGVLGQGNDAPYVRGGEFIAGQPAQNFLSVTTLESIGVAGRAYAGQNNTYGSFNYGSSDNGNVYGTYGIAVSPTGTYPAGTNYYSVYGSSLPGTGLGTTNTWAGFFSGDVETINGDFYSAGGSVLIGSDQNLKTNIEALTNTADIIKRLSPKKFNYDTTKYFMKGHTRKQYGFIAQDVEQVLPELVQSFRVPDKKDSTGSVVASGGVYKSVNYNGFIAILMQAVQEQQGKIETLDSVVIKQDSINKALQLQITALTRLLAPQQPNTGNPLTPQVVHTQEVALSDNSVIVLNQNVPNPFAESTIITYNIPVSFTSAQIVFNDLAGRIIKVVDIKDKGQGQLTVFANDLSNGVYTYTLYIDGKVFETKKMVKQ